MKTGSAVILLLLLVGGAGWWWYLRGMEKGKAEGLRLTEEEYQDGNLRAAAAAEKRTPEIEKKLAVKKTTPEAKPPPMIPPAPPETVPPEPPEPIPEPIDWKVGAPVFIRIFKEERELELWLKDGEIFRLYETYPVAGMSGDLGPKLAEGDRQAPEGFYYVTPGQMNPDSAYHLAFNIGFPNSFDRSHGRTGSFIMVHGSNVSVGCFAMTDEKIEEIYTLCDAAHQAGQPFFRVHIFPFRMTAERMSEAEGHEWFSFWKNLQTGYDRFEAERVPPNVEVRNSTYIFPKD